MLLDLYGKATREWYYPGAAEAVTVAGVTNLIANQQDMSEDLAYAIARIMHEKQADLAATHPEGRNLNSSRRRRARRSRTTRTPSATP